MKINFIKVTTRWRVSHILYILHKIAKSSLCHCLSIIFDIDFRDGLQTLISYYSLLKVVCFQFVKVKLRYRMIYNCEKEFVLVSYFSQDEVIINLLILMLMTISTAYAIIIQFPLMSDSRFLLQLNVYIDFKTRMWHELIIFSHVKSAYFYMLKSMAPLYLLWPVLSLFGKNSANKEEIVYHRNVHYPNMLPEYADVNLTGFSKIGLVECSMKCLVHTCMGHTKCVGVFHNKEIQSCKIISDNLVDGLFFQLRAFRLIASFLGLFFYY